MLLKGHNLGFKFFLAVTFLVEKLENVSRAGRTRAEGGFRLTNSREIDKNMEKNFCCDFFCFENRASKKEL